MNTKKISIAIVIVVAAAAAYAIWRSMSPGMSSDPILIGADVALSGPEMAAGANELSGARLAANEVNAAGGVLGRKIEIVPEDSKSTSEGRLSAARTLVYEDAVSFMIAPWDDGATGFAKLVTDDQAVTMLVAGGSIGAPAESPYLFRVWPSDAIAVHTLVEYSVERRFKTVEIVVSKGQREDGIVAAFERYASTTPVKAVVASPSDASIRPDAYLVVTGSTDELAAYVKQIRALDASAPIMYPTDITYTDFTSKVPKELLKGFIYPIFQPPTPGFGAAYTKAYGTGPGIYADTSYDAVHMLADAIAMAGSADPDKVRASFSAYTGASGSIAFNADGERTQANVGLLTFDGTSLAPKGL